MIIYGKKLNYFFNCFFLKFEKNLLIKAAPTPRVIANKIEKSPYKVGISTEKFLMNIDIGFRLFISILAIP